MGDLIPYRSPRARQDFTAFLGMGIFLASWAMLFAGLFFGYGFVRVRAPLWPPPDLPRLPIGITTINTAVLVLSSVSLHYGLHAVRHGRGRRAAWPIGGAFLLGAAFLALQIYVWSSLYAAGLQPHSGPYGSAFYALTVFHGLHVAVGLFALAALTIAALLGRYTPARHLSLRLWLMYWHFVGVVWALMFVTLYLV